MNANQSPIYLSFLFILILLQFQTETVQSQPSVDYYQSQDKVGAKNQYGDILIPANYDHLGWSEGLRLPVDDVLGYYTKGWGLVSLKNRIITGPRYYSLEAHHKNLIVASIKGRFSNELFYGVINTKGQVIVDFKYHSLTPIRDLILVSERKNENSYFGLLDGQGRELLPTAYAKISYFKDDLFVFSTENGNKGIIHKNGEIKVQATLDSIAPASTRYALIFKSGKVGAIDTAGLIIHEPLYKTIKNANATQQFKHFQLFSAEHDLIKGFYCDSIFELSSDLLVVVRNHHYEILNKNFESIYRGHYLQDLSAFRKNTVFKKKSKYQIIRFNGDAVDAKGFDSLQFDQNYIYGRKNKKWHIYNKFGSSLSIKSFDGLIPGSNNLIPVKKNNYWGYVDHSGSLAISVKYDQAGRFEGNMAEVDYLGSRRIINQFGEFIGASDYDQVKIEKANTALVTKRGRTDLMNYRGEILFETYNELKPHFFGYKEFTADGKVGLVSHLGEVILHPIYDSISEPKNRRYVVVKENVKTGLANFKGFWILPLSEEIEDICHVNDGLIGIQKNGQYGYLDFGQKLLIANRYEKTKPFTQALAAVKLNAKWGFINRKEKLVIQPTYEEAASFKNGISLVRRGNKYGVIDVKGTEKISIEYDSITVTTHEFLLAKKDNRLGLFNQFGEPLLQPSYSAIHPTKDDHFIVSRRGLYGLIDSSGRYSIPLKYFLIKEISNGRYICLESGPEELE